jgi:ABC-2 type transport system permease protein
MWALYRKEIRGFFSTVTAYLVVSVFLLLTTLFMWVFGGPLNIPESGYSSLDTLFVLAPWVFLLLVPAITMRMFSEEKRSGTLELLLTRPEGEFRLIAAKFLAAWTLVLISLIPTLVSFTSIYYLGSPKGNMDTGGTWGSYAGLLFLGGIYAAAGLLASSLTDNQIVAFITGVLLSFIFYLGFSFTATISETGFLPEFLPRLGIEYHYLSMSRGVIDSRDVIYFLSLIFLFLFLTRTVLVSRKW